MRFSAFLIGHWVLQFAAWSQASRSASMHAVWLVVSTPVVSLSGDLANDYFWWLATSNSALWAGVLTWLVSRSATRSGRPRALPR